jgi:long-chain acyl-CoA synthetase
MKSSDDTLLNSWGETLARKGDVGAIFETSGEVSRTFAEIETQAREFERKIDMFEVNSVLAIQIGNHPDWPAILLACLRRGVVVLPLEQSISERERHVALKICRASGLISDGIHKIGNQALPEWGTNPPSLLKLTSGTTAAPRVIRFRSEQLLADCDQISETMGICDLDLNFGVIPISHSYGFSNLLTPLIAHGVPMVLSRDRVPRAVLVDLGRTNATVFPGTPVFYQAFCEMENVPVLPSLRLCISAGAPLSTTVARRFFNEFKQPIHSFYGSSECGGICYDPDGKAFEDGFVGTPIKDVDLVFLNPTAALGQVHVRSAAVGDGYFPEPDEEKLGDGIFTPDDLLARCGDGFKIVGRISDLINVAGKKVNPAQIEEQLLQFAGVREAIAFGRKSSQRNEEVAACVITNGKVSAAELIESCRTRLSAWQVPKQIFIVDEIPVNERGKISRRELARRFGE